MRSNENLLAYKETQHNTLLTIVKVANGGVRDVDPRRRASAPGLRHLPSKVIMGGE